MAHFARRDLTTALLGSGLLIGGAAALKAGEHAGFIDAQTSLRGFGVAMGLMVAFYGNIIPKNLGAWRGADAGAHWQRTLRFCGWAFTLAGLAYAGFSLFEPAWWAGDAAMGAVVAAMAVTLLAALRSPKSGSAGG